MLKRAGLALTILTTVILAATGFATVAVASPAVSPQVAACLARARSDLRRNNFRPCLRNCNDAIKLDPKCGDAYVYKGYALHGLEDYKGSALAFKTGLDLLPNYGKGSKFIANFGDNWTYHNFAQTTFQSGDPQGALKIIQKTIPLCTNPHLLYEDRSTIYVTLNQYDKALVDINKAIALKSNEPHHYECRARIYEHTKQYKLEIADLTKSLSMLAHPDAIVLRRRGDAYKALGDLKQAKADYDAASEEDF
ncbi:MAG: tetratricopeptide repeat protein [Candidatus Obscuribacter sp.]|nr:tetratricopeptide repeat protein [Candidatus Obscuribacter sp.]